MAHSLKPTTPSFVSQGRDNGDPLLSSFQLLIVHLTGTRAQEVARSFLVNIDVLQTVMGGDLKTETT